MSEYLPRILQSRKFQAAVIGVLTAVLLDGLGLPPEIVELAGWLFGSAIFGWALEDYAEKRGGVYIESGGGEQ